jgi:hypothetical protein
LYDLCPSLRGSIWGLSNRGVGLSKKGLASSSRDRAYGRSLVLRIRNQVLAKQFQELLKLRERVRNAEAMAFGRRRYLGRRYREKVHRIRPRRPG